VTEDPSGRGSSNDLTKDPAERPAALRHRIQGSHGSWLFLGAAGLPGTTTFSLRILVVLAATSGL